MKKTVLKILEYTVLAVLVFAIIILTIALCYNVYALFTDAKAIKVR